MSWNYRVLAIKDTAISATLFFIITFICHFVTDYYTSRLVKYYNNKKNIHNMFVVIGFDQILHYLQLFLTYLILLELSSFNMRI